MVFASAVFCALTLVLAAPAYAYLDPGAGSFALQMLMAGFLAVAVTGRMYWYRIKGFFARFVSKDNRQKPNA